MSNPYQHTIVLQAVQHKSLRNPSVLQYKMLQMICPRAFFEIIRKPFDFNVCVKITRSHLTSRYIRVGLACVQGMNNYHKNALPCGTQTSLHSIGFLRSLRYSSSNTYENQLAPHQKSVRCIELQSAQFLIKVRPMGRLLFKGARPGVKRILV